MMVSCMVDQCWGHTMMQLGSHDSLMKEFCQIVRKITIQISQGLFTPVQLRWQNCEEETGAHAMPQIQVQCYIFISMKTMCPIPSYNLKQLSTPEHQKPLQTIR